MTLHVTDDAIAAISVLTTVRENASYRPTSQLDEHCASTLLPKENFGSELGKDDSEDKTTITPSGSTVAANVAFVLKTAGICLAYFSLVCLCRV
jgi:hypothetical protein